MYGDPDELQRLARRLGGSAARVREEARAVVARCEAVAWQSTASEAMRASAGADAAALHHAADRLEDAAWRLRQLARAVRERIEQIRAIEEAVTGWFADQAHRLERLAGEALDAVSRLGDAPWSDWHWTPANLPAPGDRGWLEVGDYLRRQGVTL